MIPVTICNGADEITRLAQLKARGGEIDARVTSMVSEIIAAVREKGDAAVRGFTHYFDVEARRDTLRVVDEVRASHAFDQGESCEIPRARLEESLKTCSPDFLCALRQSAENIREFHARQLRQSFFFAREDGVMLGQRFRPLHRVGVYVPGGTAPLPSSVLMNVIPAKVAGVKEIIMATPEQAGGGANEQILAAAAVAGVDRVFLVGGAQAIAALAFGTATIPKTDKITGPGNIFVAAAKKLLYGVVDIDMIAGPSEILVIADDSANPAWLAADLLSQAEHDRLASAILICTSKATAEQTVAALERQLEKLPRRQIAEEALRQFGAVFVCESVARAMELANEFAPEHLELCVRNPMDWLGAANNAGSVFLGHWTPESVGDYFAGPNHVLPTGGTPRFFSPLSVDDFVKKVQFIYYTESALRSAAGSIVTLAEAEGLAGHANAARIRVQ
ncbi:MAG: histidinol dehydrogenase [Oscillospiraceae bacterium]|jgi:histidinol dehydrogenase|nr:histidinol dehydrogenase [Oscillospiraceae bacterium]